MCDISENRRVAELGTSYRLGPHHPGVLSAYRSKNLMTCEAGDASGQDVRLIDKFGGEYGRRPR